MFRKIAFFMLMIMFAGCSNNQKDQQNKIIKTSDGKILVTVWDAVGFNSWQEMISNFNESQSEIFVQSVFKGSYKETMQAGIAAFRAGKQPNLLQIYEIGTGSMSYATEVFVPASEFMDLYSDVPFHTTNYIDSVVSYYSDGKTLLSIPFNSSTPVLYYNKNAFAKAGLNLSNPPKSWEEFEEMAPKLLKAGYVPLTTSWTSWTILEAFSARHNIPFASYNNGLENMLDARIQLSDVHKKFFQKLKEWYDKGWYVFYDREHAKSTGAFTAGKVAVATLSSASLSAIKANRTFEFSISEMPYLASEIKAPKNTLIGGASFWILKGHSAENNKATAKFINYLMSVENQKFLHTNTGYLPIAKKSYQELKEQGFYQENPSMEIPILQMSSQPGKYSQGFRLGNFVQIREIFSEEFEKYLQGAVDVDTFISNYQKRADAQLEEFQAIYEKQ